MVVRILTPYNLCLLIQFGDEVQFTVKYTNNLAHVHYHPCNEYQAAFSPLLPHRKSGLGTRLILVLLSELLTFESKSQVFASLHELLKDWDGIDFIKYLCNLPYRRKVLLVLIFIYLTKIPISL